MFHLARRMQAILITFCFPLCLIIMSCKCTRRQSSQRIGTFCLSYSGCYLKGVSCVAKSHYKRDEDLRLRIRILFATTDNFPLLRVISCVSQCVCPNFKTDIFRPLDMDRTNFFPAICILFLTISLVNANVARTRDETPTSASSTVVQGKTL